MSNLEMAHVLLVTAFVLGMMAAVLGVGVVLYALGCMMRGKL